MLRRLFSVAIYGAKRTPIGSFQGKLSRVPASLLGAHALTAAISQAKASLIHEVIFGTVLSAGQGLNPARQAALAAGLSDTTVAVTIEKGDSSGLKAVTMAADRVLLEPDRVVAAGGFENCSLAPHLVWDYRAGLVLGDTDVKDCILVDGLECATFQVPTGVVAEKTAVKYDLLRREQDMYAKQSYIRAMSAWERNFFAHEVWPIEFLSLENKKETVIKDEYHTRIDFQRIPHIGPLYMEIGSVTGANSATVGDGGAALVIGSSDANVDSQPLARLLAWVDISLEPDWFPLAVSHAILKLCKVASFPLDKVDLFELDETFGICVLASRSELKLNELKVNVNGGAVALGHPLGMTGARMLTTLLYSLRERHLKYGIVATSEGGGGATAALVELV